MKLTKTLISASRHLAVFVLALCLQFAAASQLVAIDYISYVGAEIDTMYNGTATAIRYRSPAVPKTLITNDGGIYATNGGINWETGPAYDWGVNYMGSAPQGRNNSLSIDAITGTADLSGYCTSFQPAGYCTGTATDGAQMVFTQAFDRVRIGVMWDITGATTGSQTLEMRGRNTGASAFSTSSGTISLTANGTPDIYFFDLAGVKAGDVFNLNFVGTGVGMDAYVGAFLVDKIPSASVSNAQWSLSFTDSSAMNFLDKAGSLVSPARSLKNDSGEWTASVARLNGTPGNYESLTLAGFASSLYQLKVGGQTQFFAPNAKGEATAIFGQTPSGPLSLFLPSDFLQNTDSISFDRVAPKQVISVDLQGVDGTNFYGQYADPITYTGAAPISGVGGVWNAYTFIGYQGNAADTIALATPGYKSDPLKDSAGNLTGIYFSTEGSDPINNPQFLAGWGGQSGRDDLQGDYLFGNHPNDLATTTPLEWEIGGLEAGDLYQLILLSGWHDNASFTVADEIMDNGEQTISSQAGASFWVYADAAGTISGTFGNVGGSSQQQWGGFQLLGYGNLNNESVTPEPTTWAMMLIAMLFGCIAVWQKKKMAEI